MGSLLFEISESNLLLHLSDGSPVGGPFFGLGSRVE